MEEKKKDFDNFRTKVCDECGKEFSRLSFVDYLYKTRKSHSKGWKYYCSYTCWDKALSKSERRK